MRPRPAARARIDVREAARTDLALVAALAVIAFVVIVAVPARLAVVHLPAALALIVILPGYALATAMVGPLRPAERILVSVALSLTVTILAALLLEVIGAHLTSAPWMGLLAGLTVLAAAEALVRGGARPLALPRVRLGVAQVGALVAALALLGGAAALGFTPLAAPSGTQGSTALWICSRANGCALPSDTVELGVISDQLHTASWRVRVAVAGQATRTFGPITLAPGASWSRRIATGPGSPRVKAFLYATARPSTVYRHVDLLDGRASAAALRRARLAGRVDTSTGP